MAPIPLLAQHGPGLDIELTPGRVSDRDIT
jgi:hypothetical protein